MDDLSDGRLAVLIGDTTATGPAAHDTGAISLFDHAAARGLRDYLTAWLDARDAAE